MKANNPEGISLATLETLAGRGLNGREAAVAAACLGYCEYYRKDGGEEGCKGLSVVVKGIATGRIGLEQVSHLMDKTPGPARRSGCLINEMCHRCDYLKGGCDFMSQVPPEDATPCGGYRMIQALLDCGALKPEVVRALVLNADP